MPQRSSTTKPGPSPDELAAFVQNQKAQARREGTFQKILANVPDVAWTTDRTGHTIYISPKVEAVLGYSPADIFAGGPVSGSAAFIPRTSHE